VSTKARIARALRLVTVPFPHLCGLVAAARVTLDDRLPTMGVFASGRLVANPAFVATLKDAELVFVLAHEMLHLALRTHDRARGADRVQFNVAHDYIINDLLRAELGVATIPAGGLDMPGARHRSAEAILLEMRRNAPPARARRDAWDGEDVLPDDVERAMFPADAAADAARAKARMRALAAKSASLAEAMGALRAMRGLAPGASQRTVAARRGVYRTPWQLALQRWMASVAPGERTFARPSRRTGSGADVVLPGRQRHGWLLNVVLDTSGSMADEIPKALGAIADYCDAAGVDQVRLVQCDADVTGDATMTPEDLAVLEIRGYGGSDVAPALAHLARDARTLAAIVVTDGDVGYPPAPLPFDVLWLLTPAGNATFAPPYGRVVTMR
jgi:predicted metal-dependent peptidase